MLLQLMEQEFKVSRKSHILNAHIKHQKMEYVHGTASVLEAKIVCRNGFSISIATEWLKYPPDQEFDKQDCELKAFVRLSGKLKKLYPRLPIIIAADGLYPNQPVFEICKRNNWLFIFTFKEGNLTINLFGKKGGLQ